MPSPEAENPGTLRKTAGGYFAQLSMWRTRS
jgi:hypothetical protein